MKLIRFCKKIFPYAFGIHTLHRFLWTLLIVCAALAVSLAACTLVIGLGTVGLVIGLVFLLAALYAACGVMLSALAFFDIIE